MRILGVDPGLATVGLGLIEAESAHDFRAIEWLTIGTDSGLPLQKRLHEIHRDLATFLAGAQPELAVVEKLYFAANKQTALDVAHARGVILQTLEECAIPLLEPTPMQLKLCITGDGGADKRQMQDMVAHLLHLQEIPRPDDAADALALAIFGAVRGNSVRLVA